MPVKTNPTPARAAGVFLCLKPAKRFNVSYWETIGIKNALLFHEKIFAIRNNQKLAVTAVITIKNGLKAFIYKRFRNNR
ncbi:hypothetical protein [Neisseria animaloris]|uniref:hypothetical protein n=1 Tax=Neisseria animaloris TaxID=326522 RepID=UPI000D3CF3F9|nr:hypothetical protein [Neisseria animaloris]